MCDIHKKHNYFAKVVLIDDTSLSVWFPRNVFLNYVEKGVILIHDKNTGLVIIDDKKEIEIQCPEYMIRPLIHKSIVGSAAIRGMSIELIDDLEAIMSIIEPEEKEKEQELLNHYVAYIDNLQEEDLNDNMITNIGLSDLSDDLKQLLLEDVFV